MNIITFLPDIVVTFFASSIRQLEGGRLSPLKPNYPWCCSLTLHVGWRRLDSAADCWTHWANGQGEIPERHPDRTHRRAALATPLSGDVPGRFEFPASKRYDDQVALR